MVGQKRKTHLPLGNADMGRFRVRRLGGSEDPGGWGPAGGCPSHLLIYPAVRLAPGSFSGFPKPLLRAAIPVVVSLADLPSGKGSENPLGNFHWCVYLVSTSEPQVPLICFSLDTCDGVTLALPFLVTPSVMVGG